jgi:hypothetical protein
VAGKKQNNRFKKQLLNRLNKIINLKSASNGVNKKKITGNNLKKNIIEGNAKLAYLKNSINPKKTYLRQKIKAGKRYLNAPVLSSLFIRASSHKLWHFHPKSTSCSPFSPSNHNFSVTDHLQSQGFHDEEKAKVHYIAHLRY